VVMESIQPEQLHSRNKEISMATAAIRTPRAESFG
jgi:hypothetical protein